jgi:V8-like Glu-specific endopeptidase
MKLRMAAVGAAGLGVVTALGLAAAGATGVAAATTAKTATAAPARASDCVPTQTLTFSNAQANAALDYWTPQRMDSAPGFSQSALVKPASSASLRAQEPTSATRCVPVTGVPQAAAAATAATADSPASTKFKGYPSVGKLFFKVEGVKSLSCTASVINGTNKNNPEMLILTAAHCIDGTFLREPYVDTDFVFAPKYANGKYPFGKWTVKTITLISQWLECPVPAVDCHEDPIFDYAIIVLKKKDGKGVGKVTGSNGWHVNQPKTVKNTRIVGYPGGAAEPLYSVTTTVTVTKSKEPYRRGSTPKFADGVSGGPWFSSFNTRSDLGVLLGDTGGFDQGGPTDSPSYSDFWNGDFAVLVANGVKLEG